MIRRPAALLTLLTLLVAAPVALAHEGNPNYRSVVKSVTPNTPGLNVEILNFDDRVLLHNTSDEDVEIFGYENDEPYAQVKADGTVLVNTNSKAYYLNEDRQGEGAVPQDLPSEPAWKELSKSGRFEWHDHRMHWMGEGDPPQLTDKSKETVGGSMTVQKRTVEDRCGLSRWTADATADLLRRWVDMAPPQRSVFELPNKKRALGET